MKIFILFFLAALISPACILAQDNNQVAGYRVEMPLQRQEMEDRRWKLEVEAQGCSFQKIKGSTINEGEYNGIAKQLSLLEPVLEGSSTPIFYLPSSNSYLGVSPKLMMNPVIKGAEEAIERLGLDSIRTLLSPESTHLSVSASHETITGLSSPNTTISITASSDQYQQVTFDMMPSIKNQEYDDHQASGKETLLEERELLIQAAQEKLEKLTTQIEAAKQSSKEKLGGENSWLWDRIATKLEQSRDSWNKVNALIAQGKQERLSLWKKAAEESEVSTEGLRQAIQAYISGNESEAKQIGKAAWNSYYLSDASTWSLKSEEALEKSNGEEDLWRELAEQYKVAADYERKASEAYNLGKENEEYSWAWAGRFAYSTADYQTKVRGALAIGKTILAAGYREASITSQKAVDQLKKSVEDYIIGKDSEGNSWFWTGRSFQKKADYQAKACEAEEAENVTLAAGYREAEVTSERAADQWKLSAETKASGKNSEGISWSNEGESLQKKADYQAKASDAQEAGKAQLASGYREVVVLYQKAADKHRQAAESKAAEKINEGNSWGWEGTSLQAVADYKAKACEAEESGKATLEAGYKEAEATSERAADQWELSAKIKAAGKNSEGVSWGNEGESLQKKAGYQAKVGEAEEAGKAQLAVGYREVVVLSQRAADQHRQSAEAAAIGKENESTSWYWGGKSLQTMVDYHAKAYETVEAGKVALAAGYKEVALMSQQAADQRKLAVVAYAAEKKDEGESWDFAGKSFQSQADYYKKAIEAREAGKEALAVSYEETAAIAQRAGEKQKQSALVHASGNDGNLLYCAGDSLHSQADYQAKAIEAGEAGKVTQAADYREAAGACQRAVDQWEQGFLAFAAGKENEGGSWGEAALSFVQQSEFHKKAAQAQDAGKEAFAAAYREVTEISQRAGEYHQQAAEGFALEKKDEGAGWMNVGKFLRSKASDQIKAVEQKEKEESEKSAVKTTNDMRITPELVLKNLSSNSTKVVKTNSSRKRMDNSTERMVLLVYCQKWLAETKSAEGQAKILSDYVIDVLKRGADHGLVKSFEKYWNYVLKAHELGDDSQALAWIQVAEDIQQAIKDSIKEKATKNQNWKLSNAWNDTVKATQKMAEYRELYIQPSISFQVSEFVSDWKKIVEGSQFVVDYYRKVAEALSLGKGQEPNRCRGGVNSIKESVKKLEEAAKVLKKSIDAATKGEAEISTFWRKIAEQWEKSSEYHSQAANAWSSDNIIDCSRFTKADTAAKSSANQLEKASAALEKATQARKANQGEAATLWFQAVEQYEKSAEYYHQAVNAAVNKNSIDYDHFDKEGEDAKARAEILEKQAKELA